MAMAENPRLHIPDYVPDEWVDRYGPSSKPMDVKVRRHRPPSDAVAMAAALAVLVVGTLVGLVVSASKPAFAAGALLALVLIAAVASTGMTHAILRAGSPDNRDRRCRRLRTARLGHRA
ncbi:hypothetical protein ACWEOO_29385 [Kribbella sp. NPDC004138]